MGIVGSLFGQDEETFEEVENEIVDQVEDEASDADQGNEEIETRDDETDDAGHDEAGDEPAEDAPVSNRQMAPVGAVKAERAKRQEAEKKAAEYQAELDRIRQANRQPDEYSDDPYFDKFREKVRAEMFEERLLDSDERAREKFGADVVAEAAEWAKRRMADDPTLKASFISSRKPIEMLVEQYQKDQKVNALLTDEEAYIRRRAAELGLFANAEPVAASDDIDNDVAPAPVANKSTAKTPRRSIAGGQSQGRATDVPSGRLSAVDSLFR